METKAEYRKHLFAQRKTRSQSETAAIRDARLAQNVVAEITRRGASRVSAYYPTSGEPGGRFLIPALKDAGLTILLPLSLPQGQLAWAEYIDDDHMAPGAYRIPEPTTQPFSTLQEAGIDFIIVPALGVDTRGTDLEKAVATTTGCWTQTPRLPVPLSFTPTRSSPRFPTRHTTHSAIV